eukprot:Em0015g661a
MSVCSLVDELSKKATEKTVTSPDTSKQHQLKRAKLDNQDHNSRAAVVVDNRCGCGQCSIEAFFKVGCVRLREENSFPYVNTDGLTQGEKLCLLEVLSSGSKDMYDALQNLKMEFQDWTRGGMSLQQLKDCLLSLEGTDPAYSGVRCGMLEDRREEIEGSVSALRLFCIVYDYCSWFNYYIMERIVSDLAEKYGWPGDEFEDKLATFRAVMEDYCRRRVVECPSPSSSFNDPSSMFFRLRMSRDHQSLSALSVRDLHFRFARILRVHVHALKLCHVGDGSVHLAPSGGPCEGTTQFIYSVPRCLYRVVFPLCEEQRLAMCEVGVVELQSDASHLVALGDPPVLTPSATPVCMSPEDHEKLLLQYGTKGDIGRMKILVEAGYKPGAVRDESGCTALHLACSNGHEAMVKYLVDQRLCDPNDRDSGGDSALDKLCRIEYHYLIKYFLTLHGIDASGEGCQRLMLKCAEEGDHQMLKGLVEAGCDPRRSRDKKGRTALHLACRRGREYLVTYLTMVMHCDPNDRDAGGESPLDNACRWGHLSIVHFLLDLPDIDPTGPSCQKLLLKCAHTGVMATLKKLVEAGCNPGIVRNATNQTALHVACSGNHLELVQYLLAFCDPNQRDSEGRNCLDIALEADPIPLAVIDCLLGVQGVEVSVSDCCRVLGECVEKGNVEMVRRLVKMGCRLGACTIGGHSPLEAACIARQYEVVRYLARGDPCLALLCEASRHGDLQIVGDLVRCGCDPHKARDSRGCSAVDIAREHHQNHVAEFYDQLCRRAHLTTNA